ncbi:MAG: hypothetical protein AAF318_08785 [Pseudomonadota bacterium]
MIGRSARRVAALALFAATAPVVAEAACPPLDEAPRRWVVQGDGTKIHMQPNPRLAGRFAPPGSFLETMACVNDATHPWKVRPFGGGLPGYVSEASIRPARGMDGKIPLGPDRTRARVRRGDFDATATIPCAQNPGEALGTCTARAARGAAGDARVAVTFANGFSRELSFVNGAFIRANATMSGVGTDTAWSLEGDTFVVRVDDQQYRVPTALVLGP